MSPAMPSPIAKERSDDLVEEEEITNGESSDPSDSDEDRTDEDMRLFGEEIKKSDGYEIDFSKFRYTFGWKPVDLEQISYVGYHRDFITMLLTYAFAKHKKDTGISLELVKIVRANYHPSAATTYYISFEVKDPSDANQTLPYRAKVRYLPRDTEAYSCFPKPPSS